VALADADDQHHARAASFLPAALTDYQRLVTTNLVVAECYILGRWPSARAPASIEALPRVHG